MKMKSLILAALILAVSPTFALASGPATAPSKSAPSTSTRQNANQYHDRTPVIHDRTPVLSR